MLIRFELIFPRDRHIFKIGRYSVDTIFSLALTEFDLNEGILNKLENQIWKIHFIFSHRRCSNLYILFGE